MLGYFEGVEFVVCVGGSVFGLLMLVVVGSVVIDCL